MSTLGVVGTVAISELGAADVIDVTVQCFQEGAIKSRVAGVVVLVEKALEGLLKEGVFHRRAAGGAPVEVRGGFGFQLA